MAINIYLHSNNDNCAFIYIVKHERKYVPIIWRLFGLIFSFDILNHWCPVVKGRYLALVILCLA